MPLPAFLTGVDLLGGFRGQRLFVTSCWAVLFLAGCGSGERYAPVSGTVTLNGTALADAKLIFEPIGDSTGIAAGKPSYGRTDDSGRFVLHSPIADEEGAAVGDHRVRIVTASAADYTPEQIDAARQRLVQEEISGGGTADNVTEERIREYLSDTVRTVGRESLPARYNASTELTFTVPAGGSDKADFALVTP